VGATNPDVVHNRYTRGESVVGSQIVQDLGLLISLQSRENGECMEAHGSSDAAFVAIVPTTGPVRHV
jgi:hypothetical protein